MNIDAGMNLFSIWLSLHVCAIVLLASFRKIYYSIDLLKVAGLAMRFS